MTPQPIEVILKETQPLRHPRGERLPLFVWHLNGVGTDDEALAVERLKELDRRGLAAFASWDPGRREASLQKALWLGRLQSKLGLMVSVNANACAYRFFNGAKETAHVDEKGEPFFDLSFAKNAKIGCPFALDSRVAPMREQMEFFVRGYKAAGVPIHFVFADWEIDGPIEWNDAWAASKRCKRCRAYIPRLDDFTDFQKVLRTVRCRITKEAYADAVTKHYPKALVGNYGVYPNDGYRYWYDYFEKPVEGCPHKTEGHARYRPWFQEFPLTGYTYAMPVVYAWYDIVTWYDFDDVDYRWFYNMLKVASNAGKHTPRNVPIISFVHYTAISPPKSPDSKFRQFSEEKYKELLWHLLLRGHDGLFLWSPAQEMVRELRPLHEVYAASLQYREFLEKGEPISFDVPPTPAPVVSGLRLGERVLVRRTEFGAARGPVTIGVGGRQLNVPSAPWDCQVLRVE